ncbi:MAG: hypothetical protein D6809_05515 [Gammaproteobacteria bacterium]|nr:MAG: hypothetical protein D6809_05515 [Gammaproteobacteria bacterium]
MRALAAFVMRGLAPAALVAGGAAVLTPFLPPLSYLSAAVVALVSLRRGALDGLLVAAAAGAAFAGAARWLLGGPPALGLDFVVVGLLPTWALALVLRHSVSLALTLEVGALAAGALVLLVHLLLDDPAAWWRQVLGVMERSAREPEALRPLVEAFRAAAPILTGLLAALLYLSAVGSLLLGRWWQALLYNPGGFRREFHGLRLSRLFAFLTLGVGILSLFPGPVGLVAGNVLLVLVVAYAVHGLALAHGVAAARRAHVGWLFALYVLAVVALPQVALALAVAGWADTFVDFRGRLAGRTPPDA